MVKIASVLCWAQVAAVARESPATIFHNHNIWDIRVAATLEVVGPGDDSDNLLQLLARIIVAE